MLEEQGASKWPLSPNPDTGAPCQAPLSDSQMPVPCILTMVQMGSHPRQREVLSPREQVWVEICVQAILASPCLPVAPKMKYFSYKSNCMCTGYTEEKLQIREHLNQWRESMFMDKKTTLLLFQFSSSTDSTQHHQNLKKLFCIYQ